MKAKTKAHKFAIDDLMLMTSPKVIEGMYKQNPRGFTRMMDKMYPNEKKIRQRRFYCSGSTLLMLEVKW